MTRSDLAKMAPVTLQHAVIAGGWATDDLRDILTDDVRRPTLFRIHAMLCFEWATEFEEERDADCEKQVIDNAVKQAVSNGGN